MSSKPLEETLKLHGKPILTVCCGTRNQVTGEINKCDMVHADIGWVDSDAAYLIYGPINTKRYALSHGFCPKCKEITFKQLREAQQKQGK